MMNVNYYISQVYVKLLPALLSSVPPLPEDSLGEDDDIMGIFKWWSSIMSFLKLSPGANGDAKQVAKKSSSMKFSRYNFQDWHTKTSSPFCVFWKSCQASSGVQLVDSGLSLWCGAAGGLGSCHELELTLVAHQQVVCPPSGRRGLSLSAGASSGAALQKGALGGVAGGGLAPRAV